MISEAKIHAIKDISGLLLMSSLLCKIRQGLILPAFIQMINDAKDDSIHAFGVGKATHGSGAATDLPKSSFDNIGSPDFHSV